MIFHIQLKTFMRIYLAIVYIVGLHSICLGQWKIVNYKMAIANEKYSIENDNISEKKGFVFFDTQFGDSAKFSAKFPLKKAVVDIPTFQKKRPFTWSPNIKNGIEGSLDSTQLYIRAYLENVKRYDIYIHSKIDKIWYVSSFYINNEGYQLPIIKKLESWTSFTLNVKSGDAEFNLLSLLKPTNSIDHITIIAEKKKENRKMVFALSDFKIFNSYVKTDPAKGLFFYQFSNSRQEHFPQNITSKGIGKTFPFALLNSSQELLTSNEFYFYPDSSKVRNFNLKNETLKLIRYILERYPYYKEHNIIKENILDKCDKILASNIQFDTKLDSLKLLIGSFNDSHFYIETSIRDSKANTVVPGPLLVKEFFGDIFIAAVLGNKYPDIKVGMKLLEIDNRPVSDEIEKQSKMYRGSLEARRSKAISRVLYKQTKDSTLIKAVSKNDTVTSLIRYNDKLTMPSNFVPINADFKIIERCGYIRYNSWQFGNWLALFNKKKVLSKLHTLIIDIRRNPGGENFEVMQAISSFISKPVAFSHEIFTWDENSMLAGTNIIHPNSYMSLRHLKLFILVDERTACASEAFASILREHANATIIGSSRTSGSFAALQMFHLPENINIFMNGVTKLIPANQQVVENVGLTPDIYVPLAKVSDLYPYDDKVLSFALHLAKYYK